MARWMVVIGGAVLAWVATASAAVIQAPRQWHGRELGWHEGPYLQFGLGMLNTDHDTNLITSERFGRSYALAYAGTFGWNITDAVAAEFMLRFARQRAPFDGQIVSEYAGTANLSARYSFITRWGMLSPRVVLLPYVKGGGEIYALFVRGATRNEGLAGGIGSGFTFAAGTEWLFGPENSPQLSIDVGVEETLMFMDQKEVDDIVITPAKFDPQFAATIQLGVHF